MSPPHFESGGRNVVGNVKDMFAQTIKDMIRRSLAHLRANQMPEETVLGLQQQLQEIVSQMEGERLPDLVAQTLRKFQRLKLA